MKRHRTPWVKRPLGALEKALPVGSAQQGKEVDVLAGEGAHLKVAFRPPTPR